VITTKWLVSRQLTTLSVQDFGKNAAKLLSPKTNPMINSPIPLSQNLSSRCMATSSAEHSGGHNHAKIWSLERYLSIGLLGLIPAAFVLPANPALDYLLALSLVSHIHWGIEATVADYIRPSVFGAVIPKVAIGGVYLLSALALGGLFYFNYTDVGLVTAIRMTAKM